MTRRLNRMLLLAVLTAGLPAWWLFMDNRPRALAPEPIALADLRTLADSLPGPRPRAIALEIAARRRVAGTLVAAGIGIAPRWLALPAWRLDVEGGPPVVIAAAPDRAGARALGFDDFDAEAGHRIAAALAERGALRLPVDPRSTAAHALAPGVVLVPAPGLRPGTAMVYVHLANGGDVLFALGVSPLERNWREVRAPSRWIGQWRHHESREAEFRWLATIRAWHAAAPALLVIPGADAQWLSDHARAFPFAGRFPGRTPVASGAAAVPKVATPGDS